jgi:hypothetical protein
MMKTLILLLELGLTLAMFVMIFNMTAYAMTSYQHSADSMSQIVDDFDSKVSSDYDGQNMPTGYTTLLSNLKGILKG